jgi:RNA polymerase sigma factor (sigma-70 family)
MNQSSVSREERLARFVQHYLEQAPKLTLGIRKRMSADASEAIELVQEVLVRLLEQIEESDNPLRVEQLSDKELTAYLAEVIRNRWIDRKRREEIIKRNYEELIRAMEVPATPEEILIGSERELLLRQSVAALRSPYRDLLQALLEEDTTLTELARRRKIKIGTIYTQFRRALEALRAEWARRVPHSSSHVAPRK